MDLYLFVYIYVYHLSLNILTFKIRGGYVVIDSTILNSCVYICIDWFKYVSVVYDGYRVGKSRRVNGPLASWLMDKNIDRILNQLVISWRLVERLVTVDRNIDIQLVKILSRPPI